MKRLWYDFKQTYFNIGFFISVVDVSSIKVSNETVKFNWKIKKSEKHTKDISMSLIGEGWVMNKYWNKVRIIIGERYLLLSPFFFNLTEIMWHLWTFFFIFLLDRLMFRLQGNLVQYFMYSGYYYRSLHISYEKKKRYF